MPSGWRYWCSGCCCVFVELCNWCFSFSLFLPEEVKSESAHGHPHLTPTEDAGPWKPCHEAPGTLFLFWCWCCRRFEAWQVLSQQSVGGFNAPCASLTSCGWTAVAPEHFHFVITGGGGKTNFHSSACHPRSCREGVVCEHDPGTRSSPRDV